MRKQEHANEGKVYFVHIGNHFTVLRKPFLSIKLKCFDTFGFLPAFKNSKPRDKLTGSVKVNNES